MPRFGSSTVVSSFQEPSTCDYLYFDDYNRCHLMVPLMGGSTIGLDNTCKTALEMQLFFHGRKQRRKYDPFSGKYVIEPARKSALQVLRDYIKALNADIRQLTGSGDGELRRLKQDRLKQVEGYAELLSLTKDLFVEKDSDHPDVLSYPKLPAGVHQLLARQNNCKTVRLSPPVIDRLLRMETPLFSLTRYDNFNYFKKGESFVPVLYRSIYTALGSILNANTNQSIKETSVIQLREAWKALHPNLDMTSHSPISLSELQNFFRIKILELYPTAVFDVTSTIDGYAMNEQYFSEIIGVEYNNYTNGEAFDTILSACFSDNFWENLVPVNHLKPVVSLDTSGEKEAERLSNAVQFFLAKINIYCYETKLSTKNFGSVIDLKYKNLITNAVIRGMRQGNIEEELFKAINSIYKTLGMSRRLTSVDKQEILRSFNLDYTIIRDSPHFDEFTFFNTQIPGDFFTYQNRISIHFLDLIKESNFDQTAREFLLERQKAGGIDRHAELLKRNAERELRSNNPYSLLPDMSNVTASNQLEFANSLYGKVKEDPHVFIKLKLSKLNELMSNPCWPSIHAEMSRLAAEAGQKLPADVGRAIESLNQLYQKMYGSKVLAISDILDRLQQKLTPFKTKSNRIDKCNSIQILLDGLDEHKKRGNYSAGIQVLIQLISRLDQIINEVDSEKAGRLYKGSQFRSLLMKTKEKLLSKLQLNEAENPTRLIEDENAKLKKNAIYPVLHGLSNVWYLDQHRDALQKIEQFLPQNITLAMVDLLNKIGPTGLSPALANLFKNSVIDLNLPIYAEPLENTLSVLQTQADSVVSAVSDSLEDRVLDDDAVMSELVNQPLPGLPMTGIQNLILDKCAEYSEHVDKQWGWPFRAGFLKGVEIRRRLLPLTRGDEQVTLEFAKNTITACKASIITFYGDKSWSWSKFWYVTSKSIEILDNLQSELNQMEDPFTRSPRQE